MSRALAAVGLAALLALSGCLGGGKRKEDAPIVLPDEITQQDIERIEQLTSVFPTQYSFPGQLAAPPITVWFNGTLAQGTGSGGAEVPNDNGPLDYGGAVVPFDLAASVPVGQPVEVRVNLKWWGDPGTSADLDIWADMPGEHGAYDGPRYDESMNWNIINKQRILDAVHVEGEPFLVGLQVNNGRILHPDGVDYAMKVDLHFVQDVLAPGAAYAITVPENATGLVMETERVVGDEHVDVEFMVIGPDDRLVYQTHHNDIGTETLFIGVREPGEYVVYSQAMHGGFIRFESDVPNPASQARPLTLTQTELVLYPGPAPAPGTYAEQSVNGQRLGSNTFGATGTFDIGPTCPLDIVPFIRASSPTDAALNVTGPGGWVTTAYMTGSYSDGTGRVGPDIRVGADRGALDVGTYDYGVVANGPGVAHGVTVVTYTR